MCAVMEQANNKHTVARMLRDEGVLDKSTGEDGRR